jgi:hypothetical protein
MPQKYGQCDAALVEHHHFRALSETAKLLCLFLRITPRNNAIGCFYYPVSQIADDLNTSLEGTSKGLHELSGRAFAMYCETTRWVWIPKYLEHFPVRGKNSGKHALDVMETIPADFSYLSLLVDVFGANHDFGKDEQGRALEGAWAKIRRGFQGASKGLEPRVRALSASTTTTTTAEYPYGEGEGTEAEVTPPRPSVHVPAHEGDGTHG